MLDEALATARQALADIGDARQVYGRYVAEVGQHKDRQQHLEREFRQKAEDLLAEILGPAQKSLEEILAIQTAFEEELDGLRRKEAEFERVQEELDAGQVHLARLQGLLAERDSELRESRQQGEQARRERDQARAQGVARERELAAARVDLEAQRQELELVKADRERLRGLLGNIRGVLDQNAAGRLDEGR